ncbi:hypothetical protein AMTR_s00204p00016280, partial [Amborella trichopoda]
FTKVSIKTLTPSDTEERLNRLALPKDNVKNLIFPILNDEERKRVGEKEKRDLPPPLLLLSLLYAARTIDSDLGGAAVSLVELWRCTPDSGSPTQRLVSYFAEAMIERLDLTGHPVAHYSAEESFVVNQAILEYKTKSATTTAAPVAFGCSTDYRL